VTLVAPCPLTAGHELSGFSSGVASLDSWLKRRAMPNQASGASRTFVVCQGVRVIAYYALASGAVVVSAATGRVRRNAPDPIPIVVLGRLAIDERYQRRGLGRALFRDAALRVVNAADTIGIRGILVPTLSAEAKAFYLALGFEPSPLEPMTLMVTLTDVRAALAAER
jgi:GNAT superfamily N-acetyltransferase